MKYYFMAFVPGKDGWTVLYSPDFPEAKSQGSTTDECMEMAIDVMRITVEEYVKEGKHIPEPCNLETAKQRIESHLKDINFEPTGDVTYQLIPVAKPNFAISSICVSLSKFDLDEIDYKAKLYGMKRSKFLVAAARAYHQ